MNSVIAFIICTGVILNVFTNEITVSKQVEERWSWGYVDEPKSTFYPTTTIQPPPSFCLPSYEPDKKPDYSAPGRRINEAKCMGYIWEMYNRNKEKLNQDKCEDYQWRKDGIWWSYSGQIGGEEVQRGEYPHMGAVGWKARVGKWVFKCGSSLISERFVLTAAHCSRGSELDTTIADVVPRIVRLGDRDITDEKANKSPERKDAEISRIIIHPQYKSPQKYFDIALMELKEDVLFSKFIQPACLWNKFSTSELGLLATGTGWGVVESGSFNISPILRKIVVDVLDNNKCDKLLKLNHNRNWKGFHDDQICAGELVGSVDACQGDSGGPLQMKIPLPREITYNEGYMHYVIGVISFGVGCAHRNLPGVYTRVSSFVDWIEDNVWLND